MGSDIIPLIAIYGPAALFFIYFGFGVSRAHKHYSSVTDPKDKRTYKLFLSMQYAVGMVIAVLLIVFYYVDTCGRCMIQGTIERVPEGNIVTPQEVRSDIYMNSSAHTMRKDLSFNWIIRKQKEFSSIGVVSFSLGAPASTPGQEICDITIDYKREYERGLVKVNWDRKNKKATLIHNNKETILDVQCDADTTTTDPINLSERSWRRPTSSAGGGSFLVTTAYAKTINEEEIAKNGDLLLDYSPAMRLQAKRTLIELGERALPWAFGTLEDTGKTVQQRLSALSLIINIMNVHKDIALSKEQLEVLVSVAAGTVTDLHVGSMYLLKNNMSSLNLDVLQYVSSILDQALETDDRVLIASYAWIKAELLYKLGVISKDKYGDTSLQDTKPIDDAIAYFESAWDLRKHAYNNDARFLIALWGWGNALHDLAWMKRLPLNDKDPNTRFEPKKNRKLDNKLIDNAVNKFKEFVAAYEQSRNKESYLYGTHLDKAKRYITDPDWRHLRGD